MYSIDSLAKNSPISGGWRAIVGNNRGHACPTLGPTGLDVDTFKSQKRNSKIAINEKEFGHTKFFAVDILVR